MAKRIRKLKPADLKDAALHYLGRYAASTTRLRQVITRRIGRSAKAHDLDPQPLLEELERVIAMLIRTGLLNDASFAEARARSLNRRGGSRRQIAAKLAASGVSAAERARAIDRLEEEHLIRHKLVDMRMRIESSTSLKMPLRLTRSSSSRNATLAQK